jgi:hypothetical protein
MRKVALLEFTEWIRHDRERYQCLPERTKVFWE